MRLKMALIWTSLILSSCATETIFAPVVIPPRTPYENVTKPEINQCPGNVRERVYVNLKSREQYIETLLDVIKIHNGNITE